MKHVITITMLAAMTASPAGKPTTAPARPVDAFMGEYTGRYTPSKGQAVDAEAKVVPDGGGKYRVVLLMPSPAKPRRIQLAGKVEGDRLPFAGKVGGVEWKGVVAAKVLKAEGDGRLELKFVVRTSPTEGAKPPAGAVVLLPMRKGKPPLDAWTNKRWKALRGGVMQIARGGSNSIRHFGDLKLHVEFRIPYEPTKRGQGRGNSGVYLMGRYEVQVLDSFGLVPRKGDCGAIYGVAAAGTNACLPPLRWQTYDITFRRPRKGPGGEVVPGRMTVLHNGVEIHKDVKLAGGTRGGAGGLPASGPLHLQDHGHPVQYRNIWLVELRE